MKPTVITVVMSLLIGLLSGQAIAQGDLVETISKECKWEITRFCGDVSPGRSRMLACLYAHSDKLEAPCGLALIDAAPELDQAIAKLAMVATQCGADLRAYCSRVSPGEGRMVDCLNKNGARVSERCKGALKAGGLNKF